MSTTWAPKEENVWTSKKEVEHPFEVVDEQLLDNEGGTFQDEEVDEEQVGEEYVRCPACDDLCYVFDFSPETLFTKLKEDQAFYECLSCTQKVTSKIFREK